MESHRNAIGFPLLPSELVEYIILKVALPDIFRLKLINKVIASIISDQGFVRDYNLKSRSSSWLFVYKKRWQGNSMLQGFTDKCDRWFKISIMGLLNSILPPKEDLYFLIASGNYFLFALNTTQEVISLNPMCRVVKKIPPSPLGPRGTSFWRRSGMKLLSSPSGSSHFRFLFAGDFENRPALFEYDSEADTWRIIEARETVQDLPHVNERVSDHIILSVANERSGSTLILLGSQGADPLIVRPRFNGGIEGERFVVGFSHGHENDRLHVYGDGNMMIIRSNCRDGISENMKMLKSVELWGLSLNGRSWELLSKVPNGLIDKIKKPYGVIMGCLEERQGIVKVVLMSNFEGLWDIIWLSYNKSKKIWDSVPLPDCKMKGSNMAGISFSSGLTLC